MKSNHFILVLFSSVLLCFGCKSNQNTTSSSSSNSNSTSQPNILIIHVDDLGYHDLSINGSQIYQTPNIDKLASESVQFSNAYANYPRCVPSRFAMMTGNYPVQNGDVPDDGFKMQGVPNSKNFIKNIKESGYQTAYFGKWHLGNEQSLKDFGFDYSFAAGSAGSPISFIYPFNEKKGKGKNKKAPVPDVDIPANEGKYLTDVMTEGVADYIRAADKSKPFMAMFSFYAVHQPLEAKEEDIKRNRQEIKNHDYGNQPEYIKEGTGRSKMRQDHPTYAAMVETMDENVGKLLQLLKELEIDDNTIVIFSSDHGGLSNDGTKQRNLATSNFPLRAGKGWLYDGGIKVPLFVRWNNTLAPKKDDQSLVMLMDVFPTVLDVVADKKLDTDGESFLPLLQSDSNWKDRTVFWHSSKARPTNTGDTKSSAVREGDFKLIHWYKEGRFELYNIAQDPEEQNDLSKAQPQKVAALSKKLNSWKATF